MKKFYFLTCFLSFIFLTAFSQTVPVGSYAESLIRTDQLLGKGDTVSSFTVQPLNSMYIGENNAGIQNLIASKDLAAGTDFAGIPLVVKALPFSWLSVDNPTRPYGYNNGTLYPNVGYEARFTAGLFIKAGILNIQFQPEVVTAQNKFFGTFAEIWGYTKNTQLIAAYFNLLNGIDAPERFGNSPRTTAYPGQSKATLVYKGIELGISTENLWWGPGTQNSIMMSNSAPGFLHWTFNTTNPLKTKIGSFEWQLIGGRLQQSGFPPLDQGSTLMTQFPYYNPKPIVTRYVSAFELNWQPKWLKGFFAGVSAYDYMDQDSSYHKSSFFKRIFPVFSTSSNQANNATNGDGEDFAYAINFRQLLPAYQAEFYGELARNDRPSSLSDFIQEPEHSTGYTLGAIKVFSLRNKKLLQFKIETTDLEIPPTYLVRQEPSWYVHENAPRDGYTNLGRYLGAGIGPGSSSYTADISLIDKLNSYGITFERLRHNNDLFYQAFSGTGNYDYNWVDLSATLYAKVNIEKNLLVSGGLTRVSTFNYEYYTVPDEAQNKSHSYSFQLNLSYLFN